MGLHDQKWFVGPFLCGEDVGTIYLPALTCGIIAAGFGVSPFYDIADAGLAVSCTDLIVCLAHSKRATAIAASSAQVMVLCGTRSPWIDRVRYPPCCTVDTRK